MPDEPEENGLDGGVINAGQRSLSPDEHSLGGDATYAGGQKSSLSDLSLGGGSTLGDRPGEQETVIDDIEVVDLEARYKVEGTLGRGGMGEVLLALDTRLDRKVAIKRILGEAARSKTAVERFLTEAKSVAAINHPNVVQIYDYGRAKDGPFLIMEYVDGSSLLDRCRDGALPEEDAIDLACQLCDGLGKAHDLGIIHRDIKPANVLLTKDGLPKLTDFGLAKAETSDQQMTMTGAVLGTPDFMPPEQRRDAAEVDARSDLWSLAATLYQMVTGRSPKIIRFDLLPASLTSVLGTALEESKGDRFQTAKEFRDALKASQTAAEPAAADLGEGQCPACGVKNESSRKFCRGCGESLEVPCLSCEKPMPMWEEICGQCGSKQTPLVKQRRGELSARQAEAESLLKDHRFEESEAIATELRDEADPRLKQLVPWATDFLPQIAAARDAALNRAAQLLQDALKHESSHDYPAAVSTLALVPESLQQRALPGCSERVAQVIARVLRKSDQVKQLEERINEGIRQKKVDGLLTEVDRLAALRPDRKDVRGLQEKLRDREKKIVQHRDDAVQKAQRFLAVREYDSAVAVLRRVDRTAVTEEVTKLRAQAEDLQARLRAMLRTIQEARAAKRYDGLIDIVKEAIAFGPENAELTTLLVNLESREEKVAAEIAERIARFDESLAKCDYKTAFETLNVIPEGRRNDAVQMRLDRVESLGVARGLFFDAIATLPNNWKRQEAGEINLSRIANQGRSYLAAAAEYDIVDQQAVDWCEKLEAVVEKQRADAAAAEKTRKNIRRALMAAGAVAAVVMVTAAGLWIRSSARASALATAIQSEDWDAALTIEPDNVAALVGRAKAKLFAMPPDIEGAFSDLDRAERQPGAAEKVKPVRAEAYAWQAVARAQADELNQAAQDLWAATGGGASADVVARGAAAIAKGWLGRGGVAVTKGDIQGVIRAADAALAAGADGEAVLAIWQEYAKGRIEKLDAKGLEAACVEGKKAGLTGGEQATWWIQFGQTASSAPHENAAEVIRAADAALAAGADGEAVLAIWQEYAKGRIEKLDAKGLEAACVEGKKAGLTGEEQATWWIQFGQTAASAPHENAADVIRAADAALAAGAEAGTVDSLRARGMVLEARSVLKSDVDGAVERMLEASLLDRTLAEAALKEPGFAAVKAGVLGEYRGRFDQAVAREDWEKALAIAGTADAIDPSSATWVSEEIPPLRNSLGMQLKLLPAGTFTMGADEDAHQVTLTKPFYIGVYEVTNAQWKRVMGSVPSNWKDDDRPVEQVSWEDAVEFCKKLSALPEERKAGRVYRLPTEAEWEYACRAGTTTQYSFGDDESLLGDFGWFESNSNSQTHPVGQKRPNAWGLYDMHGNVFEWCSDWYGDYAGRAATDPRGQSTGSDRVGRGGNWNDDARYCRSAYRNWIYPSNRSSRLGFRLALSPSGAKPPEAVASERRPGGSMAEPATAAAGAENTAQSQANELPSTVANSVDVEMKLIPAGIFTMGEGSDAHEVTLTQPFYLGVTEVTNAQWQAVMGAVPSRWKDADHPVEQVSWEDAVDFCKKLSAMPEERVAGRVYRLPTEAEWEYACRAESTTQYSFGDDESLLGDFGWFKSNSNSQSHPVGQRQPNAWGLYDMHGNVWEWCSDWYGDYPGGATSDPRGPSKGSDRVDRGGSWINSAWDCGSAIRHWNVPSCRSSDLGFRLALSPSGAKPPEAGTSERRPGGSMAEPATAAAGAENAAQSQANELTSTVTNSVDVELKLIPAGTFTMGEGSDAHEVTLTKPFYLGVTEVTNAQWQSVMGSVPSKWKDSDHPVEQVSWKDAVSFCKKLSAMPDERAAGREYRLPTEAEWEYACRAGTTTAYSFGDDESLLGDFAWFGASPTDGGQAHPVGHKQANAWGLYDMHGNVWEWCSDWYGDYPGGTVTDPQGSLTGSHRVNRGGCWDNDAWLCRSAYRLKGPPSYRGSHLGFRLALSPSGGKPPEAGK